MKKFCVLFCLIILGFGVKAQNNNANNTGKITGKIIDAVSKIPVDYATVSVFKQGATSPFNGGSTDPKGNIKIDGLPDGDFYVTVAFLGYTTQTIPHVIINGANRSVSIGNVMLAPVQNQLKDVVITAHAATVENKIDKLVYNPANDLTTQGGVALDVLQKVPMVTVDINGNVELMGSSSIQFLINGKPSTIFGSSITDALQAIPASQIKNIEVITNPGAKYQASGTGGIINIILKDNNVQGISGSVNLNAGTRLENASFNINAKKGKFGFSANFGGNGNLSSATPSSGTRTSHAGNPDTITNLNQNGISNFTRSGYRSGVNLTWDITKKDNLTASFNFNHFGNKSNGFVNYDQTTSSAGLMVDTMSLNHLSSRFSVFANEYGLNYKKTFSKEDQELNIGVQYSTESNTNDYTQEQDYTNVIHPAIGSIGNNPGTDKQTQFTIDYTQPITKGLTIETGGRIDIENINNIVTTDSLGTAGGYSFNPKQSYTFNYSQKVFAYYLSTTFSLFNKFFDGKAGLREEYTTSNTDYPNTTIPSYGILAPSFVLSHKLDKTSAVKFSYSYRLERPEYRSLNPFYNISDPHNISTGDPNLKPELGHNFELGYNKSFDKGPNIYVAAFYRYNTNDIQQFSYLDSALTIGGTTYKNVLLTKSYNLGRETDEGINLYGSLPVGKLTFRTNMFFADRISSTPGLAQQSGIIYRINLNTSYEFVKDLAAEFFINYRSSQQGIQGTSPAFYFYNFAVRKQFMNKKLSLGLTAANFLHQYIDVRSTTFGPGFTSSSLREIPLRSFGISLMYKFGKLEFKKEREPQDNNAPAQDDVAPTTGGGGGGGGGSAPAGKGKG